MGRDATASVSYGFIIPQPDVLLLLQKLRNSEEKVTKFNYSGGAYELEDLLTKQLTDLDLPFDLTFLTTSDNEFDGLAISYNENIERVTVWGFGAQKFEPFGFPWTKEETQIADDAFERLSQLPLFIELEIDVEPEWLLGCNMSQ